jgi:putative endonuclease
MTNRSGTLYIGVTNNLERRVYEHKMGLVKSSFSSRYKTDGLVYLEESSDVQAAITREKQLKGWLRKRKVLPIAELNPKWRDLSEDWFKTSDGGTAGLDSSLRSE